MKASLFLCAAIVVFSLIQGSLAGGRPCESYTPFRDCDGCINDGACGWCANSTTGVGYCVSSSEQTSCESATGQVWNDCTAGNGCFVSATTCDSCKENNGCGWCPASSGPFSNYLGVCVPTSYESSCPASWNRCNETTCTILYAGDCEGCKENANCKWCGASGLGLCLDAATANTTCDSRGGTLNDTCTNWFDCTFSYPGDCEACNNDNRCGWCSTGIAGTCYDSGYETSCGGQWKNCTAGTGCAIKYADDCEACKDDPACGWCTPLDTGVGACLDNSANQGSSVCANSAGSWNGRCPSDTCAGRHGTDCTACQADAACGWCSTEGEGVCFDALGQTVCTDGGGSWNDASACRTGEQSSASKLSPFWIF